VRHPVRAGKRNPGRKPSMVTRYCAAQWRAIASASVSLACAASASRSGPKVAARSRPESRSPPRRARSAILANYPQLHLFATRCGACGRLRCRRIRPCAWVVLHADAGIGRCDVVHTRQSGPRATPLPRPSAIEFSAGSMRSPKLSSSAQSPSAWIRTSLIGRGAEPNAAPPDGHATCRQCKTRAHRSPTPAAARRRRW